MNDENEKTYRAEYLYFSDVVGYVLQKVLDLKNECERVADDICFNFNEKYNIDDVDWEEFWNLIEQIKCSLILLQDEKDIIRNKIKKEGKK